MTTDPDATPAALIRAGNLPAARDALVARVKGAPTDAGPRLELAELLIVMGDLERADTHADLASTQDPSVALPTALTRQLIRAATWRRETLDQRRPPQLVTEPDAVTAASLARLAGASAPDGDDAPDLTGTIDGRPFTGLRDLDDRTPEVLEVLTSTGSYVWVPFSHIQSLRLAPPVRLRDIVWRQAELDVAGGPNGVVYIPAIYHAPAAAMDDAQRLGRATDWIERDGLVHGLGLRTFLIGDDGVSLDEFTDLQVGA